MRNYECPECERVLEVNTENFILGEEANKYGDYVIMVDAYMKKNSEFICRKCVYELVAKWLEEKI